MLQIRNYQRTLIYAVLHFVVDGLCAGVIFKYLYTDSYTTCIVVFLTYNFLAFLSQPFVGYLMDIYNNPKLFLLLSIVFLCFGFILSFNFVLSSVCLGIGNSLFHICGGKDVTKRTKNDIVSLGVFVSTGAVGLMLGQRYVSNALILAFISILLGFSLLIFLAKEEEVSKPKLPEPLEKPNFCIPLVAILIIVVMIRSFVGKITILDFEIAEWVFVAIAIATALGKMAGGLVAKLFGIRKTIIVSMVIATICLAIFNTNPYTILIGIFAFNFSMPITLWYANRLFKGKEGLAFGLLAAALIPGYLLGMLEYGQLAIKLSIALLSMLSVLFVIFVEMRMKRYGSN